MNRFEESLGYRLKLIVVIFCKDRDYHVLSNFEVGHGDAGLKKLCEIIRHLYVHVYNHIVMNHAL